MPHPEHLQPSTVVDLTQPGTQPTSFTMIKTSSEDSDSGASVKSALSPLFPPTRTWLSLR